ncbi:MAG: DsrE family protein [Chitinophagaceae bacterium]
MKKIITICLLAICIVSVANAQKKTHRIVFEITTSDTAEQRTTLRQMHNVLRDVPGTKIELVCHGPAIFMLVKAKTFFEEDMQQLKNSGVVFAACANSMRKNNLDKTQMVSIATVVPNGVMEVVSKEEDGWSYIKAGG